MIVSASDPAGLAFEREGGKARSRRGFWAREGLARMDEARELGGVSSKTDEDESEREGLALDCGEGSMLAMTSVREVRGGEFLWGRVGEDGVRGLVMLSGTGGSLAGSRIGGSCEGRPNCFGTTAIQSPATRLKNGSHRVTTRSKVGEHCQY